MNHPVVGTKPGPSPHNERTASEPHLIMIIIIKMMIIIITIIKKNHNENDKNNDKNCYYYFEGTASEPHLMQSTYLSRISRIKFVEKKYAMWRNFSFVYRIWTIYGILSKFMLFLFHIYVEKNLWGENLCGERMTNMRPDLMRIEVTILWQSPWYLTLNNHGDRK